MCIRDRRTWISVAGCCEHRRCGRDDRDTDHRACGKSPHGCPREIPQHVSPQLPAAPWCLRRQARCTLVAEFCLDIYALNIVYPAQGAKVLQPAQACWSSRRRRDTTIAVPPSTIQCRTGNGPRNGQTVAGAWQNGGGRGSGGGRRALRGRVRADPLDCCGDANRAVVDHAGRRQAVGPAVCDRDGQDENPVRICGGSAHRRAVVRHRDGRVWREPARSKCHGFTLHGGPGADRWWHRGLCCVPRCEGGDTAITRPTPEAPTTQRRITIAPMYVSVAMSPPNVTEAVSYTHW